MSQLKPLSQLSQQQLTHQQKADYASLMGFPLHIFDQLVANQVQKHHFQNKCPHGNNQPKGVHPNTFALIKDAASLSLLHTSKEELSTKHIDDQIRALSKNHIYKQLEVAIEEVWCGLM